MTRPELYRARAKEAEAGAEGAREDNVKQAFLSIAQQYRRLAEEAEQQGQ